MPVSTIDVLDGAGVTRTVNAANSNGQALMVASRPVVIASDQSAVPVSGTVTANAGTGTFAVSAAALPLPTGAATAANQTALNALLPASLGTKLAAASLAVTLASDGAMPVAIGTAADAVVASGAGGTIAGYLRTIKDAATDTTTPSPVKIDQTTPGTTNRVALPELTASANVAKTYTGMFTVAGTALTRPANVTAYSIGDSISNNATAASVTTTAVAISDTNDHPVDLVEILLDTADTGPGTAGATIRLHLYNADYTASTGVQAGDNAARSQKKNGWVGSFSGAMQPFFDGSRGRLIADVGNLLVALPATGTKNYYWELEARTAFTPSANSTTFTPTFKGFQARPA